MKMYQRRYPRQQPARMPCRHQFLPCINYLVQSISGPRSVAGADGTAPVNVAK